MSLPSLDPDRTTAGIIVDPKTLERVVPSSRRKDGTTRKELKIRPGFTPQEDVGRFRSARQETQVSKPSKIPGSNRPQPAKAQANDNPFAQIPPSQAAKTKAQLKNERRREKKRLEVSGKAWDEDSEDDGEDEEGEGMRAGFREGDLRREEERREVNGEAGGNDVGEEEFPALGGAPNGRMGSLVSSTEGTAGRHGDQVQGKQDSTLALELVPAGGDVPETAAEMPSQPVPDESLQEDTHPEVAVPSITTSSSEPIQPPASTGSPTPTPTPQSPSIKPPSSKPSSSTAHPNPSKPPPKPKKTHPIQGGRQGPLGLANPPPPDSSSSGRRKPASGTTAKPAEPRVRKEVKIREGGVGDVGTLASKIRGLVLENQREKGGGKERGKEKESEKEKAG